MMKGESSLELVTCDQVTVVLHVPLHVLEVFPRSYTHTHTHAHEHAYTHSASNTSRQPTFLNLETLPLKTPSWDLSAIF